MKKLLTIILSLVLVLSLVSCTTSTPSDTPSDSTQPTDSNNGNSTTPSNSAALGGSESLEHIETINASTGVVPREQFLSDSNIDTTRPSTANSDERYPEIHWYYNHDIVTWSPWQTQMGRIDAVLLSVYEPLFNYSDGYELYPVLAKDWEDLDDTHFQVEIYDYIYDTDGNNLTADDVVAAFNTYIESGNSNDFAYFKSVEAVDTYTVVFTWTEKVESLTSLATMMETLIYTQAAAAEHDLTTEPVGTGPYYVKEYHFGSSYTLEANDNYWQKDELCAVSAQRNVQTQVFEYIEDSEMAYIAFQEGTISNLIVSSTQLNDFIEGGKNYGQYTLVNNFSAGMYGIGFNLSSGESIMSDINLRLAVAYAIDGAGIANALGSMTHYQMYAEGGSSAAGYLTKWDEDEDNYYHQYDVELAKEYLAASGYADAGSPELTLLIGAGTADKDSMAQIIEVELESIGINVTCAFYEKSLLNTYLYDMSYWDLYLYNWNGDTMAQLWQRLLDKRNYPHGYSESGIDDDYLQEMVEKVQKMSQCTDENLDAIQQYIIDNCLVYGIIGNISYNAYDPVIAQCTGPIHGTTILYGACDYYLD